MPLMLVAGLLLAVIVHECGHFAAARYLGAKRVWLTVRWRWGVPHPAVVAVGIARWPAAFFLAGPVANLVAALLLGPVEPGLAVGEVFLAGACLWPSGSADGAKIWKTFKNQ